MCADFIINNTSLGQILEDSSGLKFEGQQNFTFDSSSNLQTQTYWTYLGISLGANRLSLSNISGVFGFIGNSFYGHKSIKGQIETPQLSDYYFYKGSPVVFENIGNCLISGYVREI